MRAALFAWGLGVIAAATSPACKPCPTCPPALPPASCSFEVSPTGTGKPAGGGNTAVVVTAPAGCRWTFQGNVPWITVVEDADATSPTGNGNGKVIMQVAPNTGLRRTGTATIAYHTIEVDQAGTNGSTCTFVVSPPSVQVGAAGGAGEFTVIPSARDCGWYVDESASSEDWVSGFITMHAVGTRTLHYTVRACSAPGRPACPATGILAVRDTINQQGATFTINQQ